MSSTICAKEVGYGAGGSSGFEVPVGRIPPGASVLAGAEGADVPFVLATGGAERAVRCAL